MREGILLLGLLIGGGAAAVAWDRLRARGEARRRLEEDEPLEAAEAAARSRADADRPDDDVGPAASILRRHLVLPWVAAVGLGCGAYFGLKVGPWLAPALGLVLGLILTRVEAFFAERRELQLEQQLGNALDLLTGALLAGSGLTGALESAVRELRSPTRELLEELLVRIRLGDRPQAALETLMERAPLESWRLFGTTLAVHWDVGGSLGPTLASVARTIRDRVELTRRMQALTMQTRVTTIVVLGSVYFIALLMWRNDPGRMTEFFGTTLGQGSVAVALVLQAAGIVWIGRIAQPRF